MRHTTEPAGHATDADTLARADAFAGAVPVDSLRTAQRQLMRELGVTQGLESELGATLTQCHALIEIERADGITTGELASRLLVEQSTCSRMVDRLMAAGWVRASADAGDRRRKRLSLTGRGESQVRRSHARADDEARSALLLLTPEDRQVVVRGVQLYAKALGRHRRTKAVVIDSLRPVDAKPMRALVLAALAESAVVGRPNAHQDRDLEDLCGFYGAPRAAYFVARDGRAVVGGAGIAPLATPVHACELRKMYVAPEARGLGLGLRLAQRCLLAASAAGFRWCYLNTLSRMTAAIRLYEGLGFEPSKPPGPGRDDSGCDRWYRLQLKGDKPPAR